MALEKIGHRVLADQLRAKYQVPQTATGTQLTCNPRMVSTVQLWVAVADPYVGLARKRPKTKWRLHWAENELITFIFAVQDICSILAT